MGNKKTDNSFFQEKVILRLDSIESIEKQKIRVLECFAGYGHIWKAVQKQCDKKIIITAIEKRDIPGKVYLKGDNMKYLSSLDLSHFDIIDLDAYGIPFFQLREVFKQNFSGIVHITSIQTGMGQLPTGMLKELGFTSEMIKQCPILICGDGLDRMQSYLSLNGVKQITGYFIDRKSYFYFHI